MPGSTPPTSQLDWLISTTAMIVLSWSRATRDLLKSFGWGIGALHQLVAATMVPFPRRLPHSISLAERAGFELSVPRPTEGSNRSRALKYRPTPNIAPNWNIAPTDPLPIVRDDANSGERSLARRGCPA